MAYVVTPIKGLSSSARRGLAFVECTTDGDIDGKQVFEGLGDKAKRDVLARFDHWITGNKFDKYFHGWPNDEDRKECFVFKWKKAGAHHRLYGFLLNPRPLTDPGFQVCVLVAHAQKNTHETDPSEMNAINKIRVKPEVIAAVKRAFPEEDKKGGKRGALDIRKR
jgi:hypothetical protein